MPITTTPSGGPQGEFSTYTPIYATTVTSGNPTSITLSNIPTTYTDLVLVASFAGYYASNDRSQLGVQVGSGSVDTSTNYSYTYLRGDGTSATSGSDGSGSGITQFVMSTFPLGPSSSLQQANLIVYFQNYSNPTTFKTILSKAIQMNSSNNTPSITAQVNLWRSTSPITTIKIKDYSDLYYFYPGTTITLYGIKAVDPSPKAVGGDLVWSDGTFWYHQFNSSGTFDVRQSITCNYLVIAGGGGGAGAPYDGAGGGGAGGLRSTVTATGGGGAVESALSLTANTYPVIIGAGGAGGYGHNITANGSSGANSVFSTITSTGGGFGAGLKSGGGNSPGGSGGSGGGAASGGGSSEAGVGGTRTSSPVQGYAGGGVTPGSYLFWGAGGGGGGAGSAGSNGFTASSSPSSTGGNGGSGLAVSITGSSVTYAGGGGGATGYGSNGSAGSGGAGAGVRSSTPPSATANTGSGGGGNGNQVYPSFGGNGGSGVVILRYTV